MKSNRQLCVSINSHQSAFNATLLLSSLYLANTQKSRKKSNHRNPEFYFSCCHRKYHWDQ